METSLILELFIYLWGAVVTFFSYKLLGIARQVNELHKVYTKTDEAGMFLGYSQDAAILKELKKHIDDSRDDAGKLNTHMASLELRLAEMTAEVFRCCKFIGYRPKNQE